MREIINLNCVLSKQKKTFCAQISFLGAYLKESTGVGFSDSPLSSRIIWLTRPSVFSMDAAFNRTHSAHNVITTFFIRHLT